MLFVSLPIFGYALQDQWQRVETLHQNQSPLQKNLLISAKLFFYNSVKYNSLIFDGSHWRVPAVHFRRIRAKKKKKKDWLEF